MADNSQIIAVNFPTEVAPGASFAATVTVKNTGDTPWTIGLPNPYRLGATNPDNSYTWGVNRIDLPALVSPNAEVSLTLNLTAPASPGTYPCSWRMLHENIVWFGPTANQEIAVVGPPVPPPPPPPPVMSSAVIPPPRTDALDLVSCELFNTGPVPIDGVGKTHRWVNDTGRTLRVKKAYLWSGVQGGAMADVHAELTRGGTDKPKEHMALLQWDRYAEPTAPNNSVYVDFDPYMTVAPDEWIDLLYHGSFVSGGGPKVEHHAATVWVQYAPEAAE